MRQYIQLCEKCGKERGLEIESSAACPNCGWYFWRVLLDKAPGTLTEEEKELYIQEAKKSFKI